MSSCVYATPAPPFALCEEELKVQDGVNSGISPYIVHKESVWARKLTLPSPIVPSSRCIHRDCVKPCAPDFWILGTRKGGTTALYTWMTEHVQVARLHIQNKPTDGEVHEILTKENLKRYNAQFDGDPEGMLRGDSTVSRIINDARTMVETCGHKHVKFIVLLRDPIERAVSNMLMRARLGTAGMSMASNLSHFVERELVAFEDAVRQNPSWDRGIVPGHLNRWHSSKNCIYEGLYAVHLRRWFVYAGMDNIRIYFTEDFEKYTMEVVEDALAFVGANMTLWDGQRAGRTFSKANAPNARPVLSGHVDKGQHLIDERVRRAAPAAHQSDALPENLLLVPALRARMEQVFAPYNLMLARMLHTTLPWSY